MSDRILGDTGLVFQISRYDLMGARSGEHRSRTGTTDRENRMRGQAEPGPTLVPLGMDDELQHAAQTGAQRDDAGNADIRRSKVLLCDTSGPLGQNAPNYKVHSGRS